MSINTATRIAIATPISTPAEVQALAFEDILFPYQRTKQFGEDYVTFGVTQDMQLYFAINGEYKYSPSQKNQVAIVKWLLSQFSLIKKYLPKDKYLICLPFSEDGAFALRVKAFARLGFEKYNEYMVYDPYGVLYQEEEEVSILESELQDFASLEARPYALGLKGFYHFLSPVKGGWIEQLIAALFTDI